jgi:predicted nucleotidyltransferase
MIVDRPLITIDAARREAAIALLRAGLAAEQGLQYAYLFGSFTEPGPFHDIDVAVCYAGLSPSEADRRAFDLHGRLEPRVGLPLDVVAINGRPATFRFHVYRGTVLVMRDEEALTADIERTAREYFDMEPLLRRATVEAYAR